MFNFKPTVPEALKGACVCLTGSSGFVGRNVLRALENADFPHALIPRPGQVHPDPGRANILEWQSSEELADRLQGLKDVVVLNVAGHFVSNHLPRDVSPLISGNLEFPLQIFEALQLSGHTRIVNIGTSWEYSDKGESTPANLYAQLKASNAQTLEWYAARGQLQAINLKLNDTYGGDDSRAKLLPMLKEKAQNGDIAKLRAKAQRFNLLHLTDVVEGLLAAAAETKDLAKGTCRTAFLLAEETATIGELTDRISNLPSSRLTAEFEDTRSHNPNLRDVWTKAPKLASWKPRVSLQDGIENYFGAST